MDERNDHPQENYSNRNGWIVCISCVVINYLRVSLVYSFGIFIPEFKTIYGSQTAELDWIVASSMALTLILAPIPTLIIRKVGWKGYTICSLAGTLLLTVGCFTSSVVDHVSWLFITFSLSFGVGGCLIFLSSTLVVNEFFPPSHRHHVMATSANLLSYPLSIMTISPLYAWIIKVTSWRIAFMIAGVKIFIIGSVCSLLFLLKMLQREDCEKKANTQFKDRRDPRDSDLQKDNELKWYGGCRKVESICWLIATVVIYASVVLPSINLPHYMENKGYGKVEASLPSVIRSLFEILTSACMVLMGRIFKGKLIHVSILSCVWIAVLFFVWPSADNTFVDIMILASVYGILTSMLFIFMYPTSLEVMDLQHDVAWTGYSLFAGLGTLLSPILSGAVFDLRESYDDVYYVTASVSLIAALILLGIPIRKYYRKRKIEYDNLK